MASENADYAFMKACVIQMIEDGAKPPNFTLLQQKLSEQYSHVGSLSNKWYALVKKIKTPGGETLPRSPKKRKSPAAPKTPRKIPKKEMLSELDPSIAPGTPDVKHANDEEFVTYED